MLLIVTNELCQGFLGMLTIYGIEVIPVKINGEKIVFFFFHVDLYRQLQVAAQLE